MFLEEKLEKTLLENKERKKTLDLSIELLNVCVDHIKEHIKPQYTWKSVFSIIKQTDNVWRSFAKKNGLNQNGFRANYIVKRLADNYAAREYFNIIEEEIALYK